MFKLDLITMLREDLARMTREEAAQKAHEVVAKGASLLPGIDLQLAASVASYWQERPQN